MFISEAFNALKGWAPQLLIHFLSKRRFETIGRDGKQRRICVNADKISITYGEAEKFFGISKPRFTRAIDDLLAKGFIRIVHQGGAYRQDKTIFGLSENWTMWRKKMIFSTRQPYIERGFR